MKIIDYKVARNIPYPLHIIRLLEVTVLHIFYAVVEKEQHGYSGSTLLLYKYRYESINSLRHTERNRLYEWITAY